MKDSLPKAKKINILTICHGDRWKELFNTYYSTIQNTSFSEIDYKWHIWANAPSAKLYDTIKNLSEVDHNIKPYYNEANIGLNIAINHMYTRMEINKERQCVLFLEEDWTAIPIEKGKYSLDWLLNAIGFVEEGIADMLYFRRYVNEEDARKHYWKKILEGYSRFEGEIRDIYFSGIQMLRCGAFYFNNPHLFNAYIHSGNIFPITQGVYEVKGNGQWGITESIGSAKMAIINGKCFYATNGIFAHYEYLVEAFGTIDETGLINFPESFPDNQFNFLQL